MGECKQYFVYVIENGMLRALKKRIHQTELETGQRQPESRRAFNALVLRSNMVGGARTRSRSGMERKMSGKLDKLIRDLKKNKYVSVGANTTSKLNASLAVFGEKELTSFYKPLISAIFTSPRVAVALVLGTRFSEKKHGEILEYISQLLPKSNVVCLNVGEFTTSPTPLIRALPKSIVGNFWYSETSSTEKERLSMRKITKENISKWGYKSQIARDDVWEVLKTGCKAMRNPTKMTRKYAVKYASEKSREEEDERNSKSKTQRNYMARCTNTCTQKRCIAAVDVDGESLRCCNCASGDSKFCSSHDLNRRRKSKARRDRERRRRADRMRGIGGDAGFWWWRRRKW